MVSVVLPVYNEEKAIGPLCKGIKESISAVREDYEIIFVNDGSSDRSATEIAAQHRLDERVKLVNLSRNFGQQIAVTAGIEHASGDAVVLMDCDMQDDPAAIVSFVEHWRQGYDVVYAVRANRKESITKRVGFRFFHAVNHFMSEIHMPAEAGLFCLMSRRSLDAFARFQERNRYLPGLRFWVGFRQIGIPVSRLARYDGKARVNWRGLIRLSLNSLLSYSKLPLRLATMLGFAMSGFAVAFASFVLYSKFVSLRAIPGWASIVSLTLFFGGTQFLVLGVLGEYIARIYDEVKMRPLYFVESTLGDLQQKRVR